MTRPPQEPPVGGPLTWPDNDTIPQTPGCYRFVDAHGNALYIGKTANLRRRLNDYRTGKLHGNLTWVLTEAARIDWIQLPSEHDAAWAEANLIAKQQPKYNLKLRDRPTPWPHITITGHDIPRLALDRGGQRRGQQRWGPYPGQAKPLIDAIAATFGMRTCNDAKLHQHQRAQRPCLLGETGKCSAPCIDPEGYRDTVDATIAFLNGDSQPGRDLLTERMRQAATERHFEHAATLRDRIETLDRHQDRRGISDIPGRVDVLGIASDTLGWSVLTMHLNNGILLGTSGNIIDRGDRPGSPQDRDGQDTAGETSSDNDTAAVAVAVAQQWNDNNHGLPEIVLTDCDPNQITALLERAETHHGQPGRGRARPGRTPTERDLINSANSSANDALEANRRMRMHDTNGRGREIRDLAGLLGVDQLWRIECLDISHFNGTDTVAGLAILTDAIVNPTPVVFNLGDSNDDYASIHAAVTRRVDHLTGERRSDRDGALLAERPDLLLVDGGPGQLQAAQQALDDAGVTLTIASLSKRLEELWIVDQDEPIIIPRDNAGLWLMQRARDRAHHVAITHQRRKRRKTLLKEGLDGIRGLGPKRKQRLLDEAGGIDQLIGLNADDLTGRHRWLPATVAKAIADTLTSP